MRRPNKRIIYTWTVNSLCDSNQSSGIRNTINKPVEKQGRPKQQRTAARLAADVQSFAEQA